MKSRKVYFLRLSVLEIEKKGKKEKNETARTILDITVVTVNQFIGNNAH